jgi:hypothetical protein
MPQLDLPHLALEEQFRRAAFNIFARSQREAERLAGRIVTTRLEIALFFNGLLGRPNSNSWGTKEGGGIWLDRSRQIPPPS